MCTKARTWKKINMLFFPPLALAFGGSGSCELLAGAFTEGEGRAVVGAVLLVRGQGKGDGGTNRGE